MSRFRTLIKSTFRRIGLDIQRYRPPALISGTGGDLAPTGTMFAGLQRSKDRKICVQTVIDLGAAQGNWSGMARQVFEDCNYLMIEPLEERRLALEALAQHYPHTYAVHAAAGDHPGNIDFFVTTDLDGSGIADNGTHAESRQVLVTTVDAEVSKLELPGPYLLKFDTHGYEVAILGGAAETLKQTELIVMEWYGFRISPQALLFWEMCDHLLHLGFRLVDLVDIARRPCDQAFWQCDAFFVPVGHPSFRANAYIVGNDDER